MDGSLNVREEVSIERWAEGEIEVVSIVPYRVNEQLALELPGDGDGHFNVTVREVRPVVVAGGSIQYLLRVSVDTPAASTASDEERRQS
jgi:hypothetical protein